MKIKAILTIVISLFIGFILGFLTQGQLRKHEMEKRHKHSYNEMFIYKTLEVIKPEEEQKDTLLPIIESYAQKTLQLKNNVSVEFDMLMRQMTEDLKPYVTEEQYNKLKENNDRLKKRYGR